MSEIYKSKFTLKFKNPVIEEAYQVRRLKKLRRINIIYSIINMMISLIHNLAFIFSNMNSNDLFNYVKITSYVLSGTHAILLLSALFFKKTSIQRWISYMNFISKYLNDVTLIVYLVIFAKIDYYVFALIFITQKFYSLTWFLTSSFDFFDGLLVYLSISVLTYGYFGGIYPLNLQFRFAIIIVMNIFCNIVSYFYINEKRKHFYFNFKNEETIKSYRSIIQNMNTGYLSIKNSKIASINNTLFTHLSKNYFSSTIEEMIQQRKIYL